MTSWGCGDRESHGSPSRCSLNIPCCSGRRSKGQRVSAGGGPLGPHFMCSGLFPRRWAASQSPGLERRLWTALQGPQGPPPSGLMMQESLDSRGLQAACPGQHEKRSAAAGGSEMLCPLRSPTQKPRRALQGSYAVFLLCLPWVNSEMETQKRRMAPLPFSTIS